MKIFARIRLTAIALASVGLLLPQTAAAGADQTQTPFPQDTAAEATIRDVALAAGGVLMGQILTPDGHAVAQLPVTVWASGHRIASSETDADGDFAIAGLRGGYYTVVAGEASSECRLWTENSAPPHASQGVLMVAGAAATRGQSGGGLWSWPPRSTTLAMAAFAGGIVAGGLIGQQNGSGS
jgi:hypothetical protein